MHVRSPASAASWTGMIAILQELVSAGYHREQDYWLPKAERRLLFEDWSFKSPKIMTLPDMYGGGISADTTPTIPVPRHQSIVRENAQRAYELGYSDGYRNGRSDRTPDERRRDDKARQDLLDALRASHRRDEELDEAQREITRLRAVIRELQRRA